MIRVEINIDETGARSFLVRLDRVVSSRRGLNAALAQRITDELIDHFRAKNQTPNRLGGARTNFWAEMADATQIAGIDDDGATITVADQRISIHVHGGTVRPREAQALTIPLHPQAHGRRASQFTASTGHELFRPQRAGGIPANILAAVIGGQLVPIYALVQSATIPADPEALPDDDTIRAAIEEEVEDFLELELELELELDAAD